MFLKQCQQNRMCRLMWDQICLVLRHKNAAIRPYGSGVENGQLRKVLCVLQSALRMFIAKENIHSWIVTTGINSSGPFLYNHCGHV